MLLSALLRRSERPPTNRPPHNSLLAQNLMSSDSVRRKLSSSSFNSPLIVGTSNASRTYPPTPEALIKVAIATQDQSYAELAKYYYGPEFNKLVTSILSTVSNVTKQFSDALLELKDANIEELGRSLQEKYINAGDDSSSENSSNEDYQNDSYTQTLTPPTAGLFVSQSLAQAAVVSLDKSCSSTDNARSTLDKLGSESKKSFCI
jgi:hypothetical protein